MDISTGCLKSDIHTWIYPWISISTASLHRPHPLPFRSPIAKLWIRHSRNAN